MEEKLVRVKRGFDYYVRESLGKKPTLVFIHGMGCNCTQWEPQQKYFEKKGFHIINMDLLGSGNSERSDDASSYSIHSIATDISSLISNLDEVIIIAHSMGGLIALELAHLDKKKVKGLILLEPVFKNPLYQTAFTSPKMEPLVHFLAKFLQKHNLRKNICIEPDLAKAKNHWQALIETLVTTPFSIQIEYIESMVHNDFKNNTKCISVPTWVVGGEHDWIVKEGTLSELVHKIKGSKFIEIKDAEHTLVIDKPNRINKIINSFIDSITV